MKQYGNRAILGWVLAASTFMVSAQPQTPQSAPPQVDSAAPLIMDVRNGDQEGKLVLKDTEMAFESLSDARQSRKWKYADIREISKKRRELSVKPFKGSKYAFQLQDNSTRDRLYKLISDRILTARQGK